MTIRLGPIAAGALLIFAMCPPGPGQIVDTGDLIGRVRIPDHVGLICLRNTLAAPAVGAPIVAALSAGAPVRGLEFVRLSGIEARVYIGSLALAGGALGGSSVRFAYLSTTPPGDVPQQPPDLLRAEVRAGGSASQAPVSIPDLTSYQFLLEVTGDPPAEVIAILEPAENTLVGLKVTHAPPGIGPEMVFIRLRYCTSYGTIEQTVSARVTLKGFTDLTVS